MHWAGLGHLLGGGALMLLMILARHRLTWWPMLRFGGASAYRRSHRFFLGLIVSETLCNGIWLVIDYFTGAIGNEVFTLQ